MDRYLDAMAAHDPAHAPLAKGARFTENGQRLEFGEGLWNTMTGKGAYRLFVADVAAGQVAFLGSVQEAGAPAMIALRLKVRNQQIAEAEAFVERSDRSAQGFEKIGRTGMEPIPPSGRRLRDELVKTANMYFSGMQNNDGKGVYPFADD